MYEREATMTFFRVFSTNRGHKIHRYQQVLMRPHKIRLVVKETHAVVALDHVVLVTGLGDFVVSDRSAGLHDVLDAELRACVDIVAEGEECVGGNCDARELGHVLIEVGVCERLGGLKELLEEGGLLHLRHLVHALDIAHPRVDSLLALCLGLEFEAEHLWVPSNDDGGGDSPLSRKLKL